MNRAQRRAMREIPRAEYQRIGDEMEASGCSRCHVRFGGGVPYLIGKLPSGKWAGRCMKPECASAFLPTSPLFVGTTITPADPWTQDDRDWFRDHPKRSWRLRWPIDGELPTLLADMRIAGQPVSVADLNLLQQPVVAVAVYQFEPGKRMRIPVALAHDDNLASYTDAGIVSLAPALRDIVERHRAAMQSNAALRAAVVERVRRRIEPWAHLVQKEPTS